MASGLRRLVWAERSPYLLGFPFVLLSTSTALAYPYVVKQILDDAIGAGNLQKLTQLSLMMVGILVVEAVATVGRDYCFGLGSERVGMRLRALVFQTLLRQDIRFFDSRDTGEITTRLWSDVPALWPVLGEEFADAMRFTVFGIAGTALLFYTSVPLTLLTLLAVPPIVIGTTLLGRRVRTLSTALQQAHADKIGRAHV